LLDPQQVRNLQLERHHPIYFCIEVVGNGDKNWGLEILSVSRKRKAPMKLIEA